MSIRFSNQEFIVDTDKAGINAVRSAAHKVMVNRLIRAGLVNKVPNGYELKQEIDLSLYNDLKISSAEGRSVDSTITGVLGRIK